MPRLAQRIKQMARFLAMTWFAAALAISMVAPGVSPGSQVQAADDAQPAPPPLPVLDVAAFGRTLYGQRCANCHAIAPGESSIAPPLHDVIGRRAGTASGYRYSVKLTDSNLVWDQQTLNEWLEKSTIATPDIRFRHVGVRDAIERLALVTYIAAANETAGERKVNDGK
jgi:cytochrome c